MAGELAKRRSLKIFRYSLLPLLERVINELRPTHEIPAIGGAAHPQTERTGARRQRSTRPTPHRREQRPVDRGLQ
jgi:hypothetical protein